MVWISDAYRPQLLRLFEQYVEETTERATHGTESSSPTSLAFRRPCWPICGNPRATRLPHGRLWWELWLLPTDDAGRATRGFARAWIPARRSYLELEDRTVAWLHATWDELQALPFTQHTGGRDPSPRVRRHDRGPRPRRPGRAGRGSALIGHPDVGCCRAGRVPPRYRGPTHPRLAARLAVVAGRALDRRRVRRGYAETRYAHGWAVVLWTDSTTRCWRGAGGLTPPAGVGEAPSRQRTGQRSARLRRRDGTARARRPRPSPASSRVLHAGNDDPDRPASRTLWSASIGRTGSRRRHRASDDGIELSARPTRTRPVCSSSRPATCATTNQQRTTESLRPPAAEDPAQAWNVITVGAYTDLVACQPIPLTTVGRRWDTRATCPRTAAPPCRSAIDRGRSSRTSDGGRQRPDDGVLRFRAHHAALSLRTTGSRERPCDSARPTRPAPRPRRRPGSRP